MRELESYALIPEKGYRTVIRKESAILAEKKPEGKLALIAKAAPSVGRLTRCPDCGAWLLRKPLQGGRRGCMVLRKR
jgi:hypothetical protein